MPCSNCGAETPDWALQCPSCGADLSSEGRPGPVDPPVGGADPPAGSWPPPSEPDQPGGWTAPDEPPPAYPPPAYPPPAEPDRPGGWSAPTGPPPAYPPPSSGDWAAGGYPPPAEPAATGGWGGTGGYTAYPGESGGGAPMGSKAGQYGRWWYRVAATIIDGIIIAIPEAVFEIASGKVAGILVGAVVSFVYTSLLIARSGQTVGMMALGLKAADADDGSVLPYPRSALRWVLDGACGILELVSPIFGLVVLLDFLWPLWDKRNQTLHDKIANSVVVHTR